MLFNSYPFIFLFLPTVFIGFFFIARFGHKLAALWLGIASLFFYGWWNHKYVLLLVASIAANFAFGYLLSHARNRNVGAHQRRVILAAAIAADLALLAYFKYANFFIDSVNRVAGLDWPLSDIFLPLGISFFTFTQITFLVDVHRGIAREYSLNHYVLFVSYFPHLIAGPVLHHKQMMPQFADEHTYRVNIGNVALGLTLFTVGLFKKVVIADQFALYANPFFDAVGSGGGGQAQFFEAWFGALAYALQLYFDFSGYSDMAIGLSKMFNVDLPLNFNSPYKAASIIDFWKRWHITLSTFLRDYLYIPLGGNRRGPLRRHLNLMLTMLLGGLWHGANWTFVVWGGLHGFFLIVNHAWRHLRERLGLGPFPGSRLLSTFITFTLVVAAWVPFRANSIQDARNILAGMIGLHGVSLPERLQPLLARWDLPGFVYFNGLTPLATQPVRELVLWLACGLAIVWLMPNSQEWIGRHAAGSHESKIRAVLRWRLNARFAVVMGVLLGLSLLGLARESQFLYFQF